MSAEDDTPDLPEDHFVRALGVRLTINDDGTVNGVSDVRPEFFAPGTNRIRMGVLLGLLDVVAGHVPGGAINPTVDLRLQIVGQVPSTGSAHVTARPLRVGRRLVVAETTFVDDAGTEFARGTSTFINNKVGSDILLRPRGVAAIPHGSIDALVAPRASGPLTLDLDPTMRISNGPQGTIQGGVQGVLAEMAVEHAMSGPQHGAVVDLDIRYLGRLTVGPLVATVAEIGQRSSIHGRRLFAVALTDAGDAHRLVSRVAIGWVGSVPA